MFHKIIEEICQESNINYTYLSKDWIIKLTKDNKNFVQTVTVPEAEVELWLEVPAPSGQK